MEKKAQRSRSMGRCDKEESKPTPHETPRRNFQPFFDPLDAISAPFSNRRQTSGAQISEQTMGTTREREHPELDRTAKRGS